MRILGTITPATRLSFGLAVATVSLLLAAMSLGFIPNRASMLTEGRLRLSEALALQLSVTSQYGDRDALAIAANLMLGRYAELESIALRPADAESWFATEHHDLRWESVEDKETVPSRVEVPVFEGTDMAGTAQFLFAHVPRSEIIGPVVKLTLLLGLAGFLLYRLYLHQVLKYLDPSSVIPERVKAMLDTMSEGVLVLDKHARIVLANEAFIVASRYSLRRLQGKKASEIPWITEDQVPFSWLESTKQGETRRGVELRLNHDGHEQTFVVNATPINGEDGSCRGALATFADVTAIEEKNAKLLQMVCELDDVRTQVEARNVELKRLASHDPLTECLNRRALFERMDAEWSESKRHGHPISCIMLDIDHFKLINDNHGHATGDTVLKCVAAALRSSTRSSDLVGRYGGEEFCLLLPHIGLDQAMTAAEKIRTAVAELNCDEVKVTISLGVSAIELGADSPQELIDQSDRALYAAKHGGRNQSIRADEIPDEARAQEPASERIADQIDDETVPIPYPAVLALTSALTQRDTRTGEHSRRVADLCVRVGHQLLSAGDCFVLEVAAMLHDIGKIGVPDAILLKPGPLTDKEWEIMETHDRIGIEIINSAFDCPELTNIVRNHHAHFGGSPRDPGLPTGRNIPLRARLLSIADAYDAMTSDRVYRRAMSHDVAIDELRRCAGTQFDPELVDRFVEVVSATDTTRTPDPVGRETALVLQVSLATERLLAAMDGGDLKTLAAAARHLASLAVTHDWPQVKALASELATSVGSDFDVANLIETAKDLMYVCDIEQRRILADAHMAA